MPDRTASPKPKPALRETRRKTVTRLRWQPLDAHAVERARAVLDLTSDNQVIRLGLWFLLAAIEKCPTPEAALELVSEQRAAVMAIRPGPKAKPAPAAA